ncbi:Ppx/GppA family phosphatase [Pseudotabrizicola alkalilacus]|uniref:Ppx/GppA family phosphatase n=1 Tax=Pseudotabrizicola alkalilacus TaxID=2305252 RepID=A0A411Z791_9RHOB|nr:Ppx/GppA family phosphatase [Pseudotabrizicola alkalilacus]RGP38895.1 Ppx/GppA family phosphatase [Pseudotabrizicola alkalilacus]
MTSDHNQTTADADEDEFSPFGRPLFEDSSVRALSRVGVVDVGSNSVRLVVFDGAARSPAYFYNEKILCGLGKGLGETGMLNPEGKRRALAALKRFSLLAGGMGAAPLSVVATAATREAADGPEFTAQVLEETGLRLHVIDGDEEARLSAQGVLLGWPEAKGVVCDIGGNSMELARVGDGKVGTRVSTQLGPFRLQQVEGGPEQRRALIHRVLTRAQGKIKTEGERFYMVGGSWRVIARLDMERRNYPLTVLHEYRMPVKSALDTLDWLEGADLSMLRGRTGTSVERMELVPLACEVLRELIRVFKPSEIDISSYGIREGLLYEQMPDKLRARDPLIEAARAAEQTGARLPGSGKKLYEFLLPLFKGRPPERLRLIKAACLLHDTTWRAHPDYRADVCFDNATRANLGGLDHPGRVFLGLSLLHRYKNSRSGTRLEPLFRLLSEDEIQEAEVLGKAMRFGAMFAAGDPSQAGQLVWKPKKRLLDLQLTELGVGLYGEVARARFSSLTQALRAKGRVVQPGDDDAED